MKIMTDENCTDEKLRDMKIKADEKLK